MWGTVLKLPYMIALTYPAELLSATSGNSVGPTIIVGHNDTTSRSISSARTNYLCVCSAKNLAVRKGSILLRVASSLQDSSV